MVVGIVVGLAAGLVAGCVVGVWLMNRFAQIIGEAINRVALAVAHPGGTGVVQSVPSVAERAFADALGIEEDELMPDWMEPADG